MMPLPQIDVAMTMAIAVTASSQFCWQLLMAEPESVRPMAMTIGPVTTGGKKRITFSVPNILSRNAMTK